MNHVFQPLYNQYGPRFKNYMDDCGIFTREGEQTLHQQIMADFFNILQQNSLFLKPEKCSFKVTEIDFLGLQLMAQGITISPDKLTAITEWPRNPRNLKELYQILGILGYQQPFIPNFAKIARPMTTLLKKNTDFIWTPNCAQALDMLIQIVCSHPVLVAPDQDRQFELEVDVSQYALGAILWQRGGVSSICATSSATLPWPMTDTCSFLCRGGSDGRDGCWVYRWTTDSAGMTRSDGGSA